jgi:alpha-beta hydrolase superfamily lysophospholipase
MFVRGSIRTRLACLVVACLVVAMLWVAAWPVGAQVVREDETLLGQQLKLPINKWSDAASQPKAVVVALHGLIMHGGSFDALAKQLVEDGCVVYSLDFRGHGRWYKSEPKSTLDYEQGEKDLLLLAQTLKQQYPLLPIFYVGESLGADMSIRLAGQHRQLVDGLVLSSPAIKRRSFLSLRFVSDIMRSLAAPNKQLNISPYMKRCVSDDPRVTQEILDDPLVRKNLSRAELMHSCRVVKSTMDYVRKIPADVPVLIVQGSADRTVKANAVVLLLKQLKSNDQTVRWLPQRGHVLLETQYLQPLALDTVSGWIKEHQRLAASAAAKAPAEPNAALTVNTAAETMSAGVP